MIRLIDSILKFFINFIIRVFSFNTKIQATRHLTPKSQIPFRIVPENGSAVPISIQQRDLTAVKINAELPLESIL